MKKVAPFKKGDNYIYSIWNLDLKPNEDFKVVDKELEEISEILKEANVDYEIYVPVALGHWSSKDEMYLLFIKKENDENLSEDEHDYISYLLSNGQLHADIFEEGGVATCNQLVIGEGSLIYNQFGNTKRTKISQESEVEIENEEKEEKMESGGAIQTSLFFEDGGQTGKSIPTRIRQFWSIEKQIEKLRLKIKKNIGDNYKPNVTQESEKAIDKLAKKQQEIVNAITQKEYEDHLEEIYEMDYEEWRGETYADGGEAEKMKNHYFKSSPLMSFKDFKETLREANVYGKDGLEMYYLPNNDYFLGKKFNHKNKEKAYQQYKEMYKFHNENYESGGQIDEEIEALDNRIANLEELYIVLNEDEQPDMRETINKLEKEKADLIRKKEKGESGEAPKKRWGFFQEGGTTPTFIKYKDNEIMFAPWINKYYVDDVEYDTLEEAQLHIDEGREGKIIYNDGGEIGFIPMDLEQQLFYIAKRGGISIKGVVGILSAMVDTGITEEDLDVTAKSGTAYQNKLDKKTLEIWNKIEPSYKGDLKGNMYYSALRELITKKDLLSKFKPYRKNQKFEDGGETDKNKPMIEELRNHFQDTAYSIESLGDNQFVIYLQVDATLDEVEQKLEVLNKVHEEEWMNGIQPYSNLGINADLSSDGRQALVIEYLGETYSEGGSTEDESASAYIKAKIKNLEENLKDPNISDYQRERDEKELALFKSGEQFDDGGDVSSENAEMVLNNSKQIEHHSKELSDAVKESKHVPAWVVAKVNRSASDLSDATHYLDGENDNYAEGGSTSNKIYFRPKTTIGGSPVQGNSIRTYTKTLLETLEKKNLSDDFYYSFDENYGIIEFSSEENKESILKILNLWDFMDVTDKMKPNTYENGGELTEMENDKIFNKVYDKYNSKDYWDVKGQTETQLRNWKSALEKGDKNAEKYTEQQIRDIVAENNKVRTYYGTYLPLVKAINTMDKNFLQSRVRYDQKVTREFFEELTNVQLPKTNKELEVYFNSVQSFKEGGSTESDSEDWLTQAIEDLKSEQDDDSFVVTYENELDGVKAYNVEGDSGEFLIFENEDEAQKYAIAQVRSDMEDDISMFKQDFISGYIEPKGFFRSMFEEMNESYANDIKSESDDEYPNRLIREMVERDLMTESEAQSDVAEDIAEEKQEDFVEQMTKEALEQGNDGYDYYKSNFGEEEANKLMINNNLIDLDGASEGAVQLDGVAHFLASYDGEQIDLDNGAVAYKTN